PVGCSDYGRLTGTALFGYHVAAHLLCRFFSSHSCNRLFLSLESCEDAWLAGKGVDSAIYYRCDSGSFRRLHHLHRKPSAFLFLTPMRVSLVEFRPGAMIAHGPFSSVKRNLGSVR